MGWAHTFDPTTQMITPKVLDFPPSGLKSTLKLTKINMGGYNISEIHTDCPSDPSETADLTPSPKVEGTSIIESCLVWPNAGFYNDYGYDAFGRYENYIIHKLGAWDPETLINTGNISALPNRSPHAPGGQNIQFTDYVDEFIFIVNKDKNLYTRFNLKDHSYTRVNLDDYGYLADKYKITKDFAFIDVLNSANSNIEFVKLDFSDGSVEFLGTISKGERNVISIAPINF